MKKIILIITLLFLFSLIALANNEYDDFMKSLKLNAKQLDKIEQIEKKYSKQLAEINSQIILKNMQIAMSRNTNEYIQKYTLLNNDIMQLNEELFEVQEKKSKEILSKLNFFQKIKYKKYLKKQMQ